MTYREDREAIEQNLTGLRDPRRKRARRVEAARKLRAQHRRRPVFERDHGPVGADGLRATTVAVARAPLTTSTSTCSARAAASSAL